MRPTLPLTGYVAQISLSFPVSVITCKASPMKTFYRAPGHWASERVVGCGKLGGLVESGPGVPVCGDLTTDTMYSALCSLVWMNVVTVALGPGCLAWSPSSAT